MLAFFKRRTFLVVLGFVLLALFLWPPMPTWGSALNPRMATENR